LPTNKIFTGPKLVLGTYDNKILRANNLHQAILAYLGCKDNCRLSNRGHFFLLWSPWPAPYPLALPSSNICCLRTPDPQVQG